MKIISINDILLNKVPAIFKKYPKLIIRLIIFLLEYILKTKEINKFVIKNNQKIGIEFLDSLFTDLNFSYNLSANALNKIPKIGKVMIVCNHPLGGLDGLAMIKAIYQVRKDVQIVVNDFLLEIDNLSEFFLAYNVYTLSAQKNNIRQIEQAIESEKAIIFFPAGKVSRLSFKGIKDEKWLNGAMRFALKFQMPVLPVYIDARNSLKFYVTSLFSDFLSMLLLPSEIFNKRNKSIELRFGNLIEYNNLNPNKQKADSVSLAVYKYIYDSEIENINFDCENNI